MQQYQREQQLLQQQQQQLIQQQQQQSQQQEEYQQPQFAQPAQQQVAYQQAGAGFADNGINQEAARFAQAQQLKYQQQQQAQPAAHSRVQFSPASEVSACFYINYVRFFLPYLFISRYHKSSFPVI